MIHENLKIVKLLLRRFLVFWGVVFTGSIVFTVTATVLYVFKVPIVWQFWIALGVGAIVMGCESWLLIRVNRGEGE